MVNIGGNLQKGNIYTNSADCGEGISAAVVIPVYKELSKLDRYELVSLKQCFRVLYLHPIVLVAPENLDLTPYLKNFPNHTISEERFDHHFFADITGYNALMLSIAFYSRFSRYDYILIYQLDAWVFKDELMFWCHQGYDYIGAPWLTDKLEGNGVRASYRKWKAQRGYRKNIRSRKSELPIKEQFYNRVGNGGFSLRKTSSMISVLETMSHTSQYYLSQSVHYVYNEDVFWSLEVNRKREHLRIPNYEIAAFFSIEFKPDMAFRLTEGKLPFGCHDWDNYLSFWKGRIQYSDQ